MKKKLKILITGCAGFIGSNIANNIDQSLYQVYGIDDLSTGSIKNLKKINFIRQNCENISDLDRFKKIKKIDVIIHCAGQSSGEKSFYDPYNDFNRNLKSTLSMLDFAERKKCNQFIFLSSMSVYGDLTHPAEDSICKPISFYGNSKLAAENYIKMYKKKGINFTIFRLFNVYGVNQKLNRLEQGMLRIYLTQLKKFRNIKVKGSLFRFRDFIYIDDVVFVILQSINNKLFFNHVINIGTGKKTTVLKIIQILKKVISFKFSVKVLSGTPDDQFGIYANISKIKKMINFNPTTDLTRKIKKIYVENF
jgi:UDP-glucose 4-epimerase